MSNENRGIRTMAITALVLASVSLVVSLLVAGFTLHRTDGEHSSNSALPKYLSEKKIAEIADSIDASFNAADYDALYDKFDPAARAQISVDLLKKQVSPLRPAIGTIDTASFVGGQKIDSPGTLPMYQLQYALKLSGGDYRSGSLTVKIMDHGDHEGIIFFYVGGTVTK